MGFLTGLGGIIGGGVGLVTGGFSGAVTGFKTGESLFGGGGSSHPSLPALGGGIGGILNSGPQITMKGPAGLPGYSPSGFSVTGGGGYRKRRRMNPMNVKAARRSLRRIESMEKLFHKLLVVTHPGHVGHVKPKRLKRGR